MAITFTGAAVVMAAGDGGGDGGDSGSVGSVMGEGGGVGGISWGDDCGVLAEGGGVGDTSRGDDCSGNGGSSYFFPSGGGGNVCGVKGEGGGVGVSRGDNCSGNGGSSHFFLHSDNVWAQRTRQETRPAASQAFLRSIYSLSHLIRHLCDRGRSLAGVSNSVPSPSTCALEKATSRKTNTAMIFDSITIATCWSLELKPCPKGHLYSKESG